MLVMSSTRISKLSFLFLSLFFLKANAQKTEVGVLLGVSSYYGDIVNTYDPSTFRFAGTFFLRYHLDPRLAIRANLAYARVTGADSNSKDSEFQRNRNMSFFTDIIELSAVAEYNLIADKNKGRRVRTPFIPYVYGGIGVFYYEPWATYPVTGQPIRLRPLQTDGSSYSPIAICIPVGIGFRIYLSRNWQLGAELGARLTSTSHIDDVDGNSKYPDPADLPSDAARVMYDPNPSPKDPDTGIGYGKPGKVRGKVENINDIYFIGGVTLSYRLWPGKVRSYGGKAIRCPRFY
jgi:hypothetical protein